MFKRQYSSSIEINAPCSKVWDTLITNEDYPLWNTFTTKVELDWEIGSAVKMVVQMKPKVKPILQTEYLTQYEDGILIAWGMKWGPFLQAERVQSLNDEGGTCTYQTVDTITGSLVPLVHLLYGRHIQAGFDRVCQGLKKYAESVSN